MRLQFYMLALLMSLLFPACSQSIALPQPTMTTSPTEVVTSSPTPTLTTIPTLTNTPEQTTTSTPFSSSTPIGDENVWQLLTTLEEESIAAHFFLSSDSFRFLAGERHNIFISPNSHWLVGRDKERELYVWDLTASQPITVSNLSSNQEHPIYFSAISANHRWLVTHEGRDTLDLWDLTASTLTKKTLIWDLTILESGGSPISLPGDNSTTPVIGLGPTSLWLFIGQSAGTFHLWDLTTISSDAKPIILRDDTPDRYGTGLLAMSFSPDEHWLATTMGFDNDPDYNYSPSPC